MSVRSPIASGDQTGGLLAPAITFVCLPKELLDVQRLSLAGLQRAEALVDVPAKLTQLVDMREQLPTDLFLIRGRKAGNFGDGLLQRLDHADNIAHPVCMVS